MIFLRPSLGGPVDTNFYSYSFVVEIFNNLHIKFIRTRMRKPKSANEIDLVVCKKTKK